LTYLPRVATLYKSPAVLGEHVQKRASDMDCLGSSLRRAYHLFLLVLPFSISAAGQVSLSVQSVSFGGVQIGSSLILPMAVSNNGKSSATISQVNTSGVGFSFAGPNLPITLAPQQSTNISVCFNPQTTGAVNGSVMILYSAYWGGHNTNHSGTAGAPVTGTGIGTGPGYLSAPANMNLGSVTVGGSQTQLLAVSNTGASNVTISAATVGGSGFTVSGINFPYTLLAGGSTNLSVTFSPTTSGTDNATLTLTSNASDSSASILLSGSGTLASGSVALTPGSMSFGNVTIGTIQSQNGSLTANGGSVTLSSMSSNNSAFNIGGLTLPVTLAAGQSVPFTVTFSPTTAGTTSATINFFTSNSTSASEIATGSGATTQHIVELSWSPSTSSSITGYNIYRAATASGPFSKINAGVDASLSYSDNTVQSGQTYYYATTAVDMSGVESSYSNQVQAVVPFP